jgi:hypothetical protein
MNDFFFIDCFFKESCMAQNFSRFAQRYAILGQPHIARDIFVKGTVALDSLDFGPSVFSSINPIWSLINRLKPFRIWFHFHQNIRRQSRQILSRAMRHSAAQTHIR